MKGNMLTSFQTSIKCRATSSFMYPCADRRHVSISEFFYLFFGDAEAEPVRSFIEFVTDDITMNNSSWSFRITAFLLFWIDIVTLVRSRTDVVSKSRVGRVWYIIIVTMVVRCDCFSGVGGRKGDVIIYYKSV